MVCQLLPHVVGFALELNQRIASAVPAQAYTLAHLVQSREVVHPQPVDRAQHYESLQRPHLLFAQIAFLSLVGLADEAKHLLQRLLSLHACKMLGGELGG